MLRNDLKQILPEGWKDKFQHRQDWDPEGYGVASFDLGGDREKVLAINFKTEDIMEYFYDDIPDDEWISLDRVSEILNINKSYLNNRKINKHYKLKRGNRILTISNKISFRSQYPKISFSTKTIFVHRLIAVVFVPNINPKINSTVNHIDCAYDNFNKENLEWCDIKWNNQKMNRKSETHSVYYLRSSDNAMFSSKELDDIYGFKGVNRSVERSIRTGTTYKGDTWLKINLVLYNYLKKHPLTGTVYNHPLLKNISADSCGILIVDGKLKVGCYDPTSKVYKITINGVRYNTHRLLAECYFNKTILNDEVVDHISPITDEDTNNEISNLRVCTQKENSRNESTLKKKRKLVRIYDIFGNLLLETNDRKEVCSFVGLKYYESTNLSSDSVLVNNKYIIIKAEENLEDKLDLIYYKFDMNHNIVGASVAFCRLRDKTIASSTNNKFKKLYLNTGMPASDGYYYQQGDPQNMIYDPNNMELVKKKKEIVWKFRKKKKRD